MSEFLLDNFEIDSLPSKISARFSLGAFKLCLTDDTNADLSNTDLLYEYMHNEIQVTSSELKIKL
jgi:hypothetical protein